MRKTIEILKIKFDIITIKEALEKTITWAKNNNQYHIATPNPEMLLEAQKNPKFLKTLNKTDLNIADGTGILWASKYLQSIQNNKSKVIKIIKWVYSLLLAPIFPKYIQNPLPQRVTGTDLMEEIVKNCSKNKITIFLLGAKNNAAEKCKKILENRYPETYIIGTYEGTPSLEDEKKITDLINLKKPDILFVAYGAPSQEFWISRNLKTMPSVKVAMGIGGAFDFIAGNIKRAPKWMQTTGLEWLYRLIQEPKRIKRIYNAIIKYPLLVLKKSL